MSKIRLSMVMVLVLVVLAACATGTKTKMVSSYELAGLSLTTARNTVKPACVAGQIAADRCAQMEKIYKDARSAYLLAGDSLALAVETDNLIKRQAALTEYQGLAATFTKNTGDIINLLVELGILKKGGK